MKEKKIRHSFATYKNTETWETVVDVDEVAKSLFDWGNIPFRINDLKAMELHCLAKAYLKLQKRLKK